MNTKRILRRSRIFLLEMVTIIIGVSIAFWLNQWKEGRNLNDTELKSLAEIRAGLNLDLIDIQENIAGHNMGLDAIDKFRSYFLGLDSIPSGNTFFLHRTLVRNFISIQNSGPYEAVKNKGLDIITSDSIRLKVIQVYDFQFEVIQKLEEEYAEMQFFENYAQPINNILLPSMQFNNEGKLHKLKFPPQLSYVQKNEALLYLLKIEDNRRYIIRQYNQLSRQVKDLVNDIDGELERRGY